MEQNTISIEETLNAPVEKVWQAITDIDQLKIWYFEFPDFKPEVGFEFQFYGHGQGGEKFLHLCKIIEVEFQKKLQYSWRYDGFEGISFLTFELIPHDEKTILNFSHVGLATFPRNNPDFSIESFNQGWTQLLKSSLKNFVENGVNI
jgi:uncharacterized protein YndB with AHSA1/START domain